MPYRQSSSGASPAPQNRIVHSHFDVFAQPRHQQLLAWRDRLGQIIDVVPSLAQLDLPFRASIDRYDIGEFLFGDCYTDQIVLDRSIARISQDNARSIVFHVFLEGSANSVVAHSDKRRGTACEVGILAVDLDQTVHVLRQACRHVTLFAPGKLLQDVFADPGALHGRVLAPQKPAVRLIVERVVTLVGNIRRMSYDDAHRSVCDIVHLIVAAFGEEAGLSGSKRAIARAVMFDDARRFIRANLEDCELTPEHVIHSLGFPRSTIFRLFRHEGGLGAYMRHLRLRAAANDLVRFPTIPVKDIAYSVGFKSASDFTRAFRRAYDITPQEVRLNTGLHAGRSPLEHFHHRDVSCGPSPRRRAERKL
jgi:AraC-like DNA-binding protein